MDTAEHDILLRLAEEEHELLVDCLQTMERTTRRAYLSPVTGILLHEMECFHERMLAELERHAGQPSLGTLLDSHRIIDLRIKGLEIRCTRGDDVIDDLQELIGDWYRLHAIRHEWMRQTSV